MTQQQNQQPLQGIDLGNGDAKNYLDQNSCLLIIERGIPTMRKKVKQVEVLTNDTDIQPQAINVTKQLMVWDAVDIIKKADEQLRHWIDSRALPTAMMRSGAKRLPLTWVEAVNQRLKEYAEWREDSVKAMADDYEPSIASQREILGELFSDSDYKPWPEFARGFYYTWRWVALAPSEQLFRVSPELMAAEKDKQAELLQSEVSLIRDALRKEFSDLITHMSDRLEADADGNRKTFRDSIITNIKDFTAVFRDRNLCGDEELAALVSRAEEVMDGVKDPQALRDDNALAAQIADTFTDLKKELDDIDAVKIRPARKVRIPRKAKAE